MLHASEEVALVVRGTERSGKQCGKSVRGGFVVFITLVSGGEALEELSGESVGSGSGVGVHAAEGVRDTGGLEELVE